MTPGAPTTPRIRSAWALASVLAMLLTPGGAAAGEIAVKAVPVELNPERPAVRTVGKLVFLSGFELVSDDPGFGGLSGLEISPDGKRLRAVSDRGTWIAARLAHNAGGHLVAFDSWRAAPMLTPAGKPVRGRQRDAEGLARSSRGTFLVSFERRHRIWRYPTALDGLPRPVPAPRELNGAPANGGLEGIAVLSDGAVLGMTERHANDDGSLKGWLMKDGAAHEIAYMPASGLYPTGLAPLPDGGALLLERGLTLSGIHARIVRVAKKHLEMARRGAGTRVRGEIVTDLKHPMSVDNFEGLALRRDPAGRMLLYLVSDDNFRPFQRTLLLQFRMIDDL